MVELPLKTFELTIKQTSSESGSLSCDEMGSMLKQAMSFLNVFSPSFLRSPVKKYLT